MLQNVEIGEWSFSILGTGSEDFRQGYGTICYHLVGNKTSKKDFYGVQKFIQTQFSNTVHFCL